MKQRFVDHKNPYKSTTNTSTLSFDCTWIHVRDASCLLASLCTAIKYIFTISIHFNLHRGEHKKKKNKQYTAISFGLWCDFYVKSSHALYARDHFVFVFIILKKKKRFSSIFLCVFVRFFGELFPTGLRKQNMCKISEMWEKNSKKLNKL